MEFDEKLDLCEQWLSEDYMIDKHTAHRIIRDLEIEDKVFELYQEELEETEKEKREKWQEEIEQNKDLYFDDIHGGV